MTPRDQKTDSTGAFAAWLAALCGFGLARENLAGVIVLLAMLTALGFVWSRSAITRRSVEYDLQSQLAGYFQAQNKPERAAHHAAKAAALKPAGGGKSP